jgi:hypothetical protein
MEPKLSSSTLREHIPFNVPKFAGVKRGMLTIGERKALHLNNECGGVKRECEYCLLELHHRNTSGT